jgi:predicted phosphatase
MKNANDKAMVSMEDFSRRVQDIYLEDLKRKNETLYNQIVEAYNVLKKSIFSYNTQIDKYSERLSAIVTEYDLKDDAEYQSIKKRADSKIAELENLNKQMESVRNLRLRDTEVSSYEKYNQDLEEVRNTIVSGNDELVKATKDVNDYVMPKVKAEEDAYYKKIETEENQRKIEENTGSISIKKTGQTLKITRDIEDIKASEEEVFKEGVRVLDFSKEKYSLEQPQPTSNENVIKKGRNILIN